MLRTLKGERLLQEQQRLALMHAYENQYPSLSFIGGID